MTETKPFLLRPFQKRLFTHIMQGESVILQAPTGSGKTRAALMPFLQNLAAQGSALPFTCRYAVPQRVLANQFYREYHNIIASIDRHAPTRLAETYKQLGHRTVALQTGEQPDDPQLESALTFCTIDQLLASFLAIPYGMGPSRANVNVAGVLGSYLTFDEFHLYPLLRNARSVFGARTTTLTMLRLLKPTTPFVLMTATYSSALLAHLQSLLGATLVKVDTDAELAEIAQGRTRTFWRSPDPMDAAAILSEHRARPGNACTLVTCNSVSRAQALFLRLQHAESEGTRVLLLHSRFALEDRRRLSEEVEHELGPQQWQADGSYLGRDIIVIATQVVEVGLDISVQVLHTENAPASSLIQRAGRCARFAEQQGTVIVYPLQQDEAGHEASTLPYNKLICQRTWEALATFHGQPVGFPQEQQLIDAVHTEEDLDLLQRYKLYEGDIRKHIFASWNTNKRSASSELIRDVAQVQILIHNHPDAAIQEAPWRWQSFSMHPDSLRSAKRWATLQERGAHLDWVCKKAEPLVETLTEPDGAEGMENRERTVYQWNPVTTSAVAADSLFIAFPDELAYYDANIGFALLDGRLPLSPNGYQSTLLPYKKPQNERNGSRQTSYQGHIAGLLRAYRLQIANEVRFVAQRLEHALAQPAGTLAQPAGTLDQAIRLAIACHDLGKLNQPWQHWALSWQTLLFEHQQRPAYQLPSPAFCFAKTDYNDTREQREWQREVQPKRPRHACESVAIGRQLIAASLGITKETGRERIPILRAICGAIARHHSAQASEYGLVQLNTRAIQAASEALQDALQGTSWDYDVRFLETTLVTGGDLAPISAFKPKLTRPDPDDALQGDLETLLYFVIVRALRLADQRAG